MVTDSIIALIPARAGSKRIPNKNTKDQKNDFKVCLDSFIDLADYITINISSPNTEGLRDFHDQEKLEDLLLVLNKIKKENKTNIPLL